MVEPLAKLPDFYLQLPLFVHNDVYNESYALLDSIEQILRSLTELTSFDQLTVLSYVSADSSFARDDQVIAFVDGQLDALDETINLLALNGYPDLIASDMLDTFQCHGRHLVSGLNVLAQTSITHFTNVSHDMLNLAIDWNRRLNRLVYSVDALDNALVRYQDIQDERRKQCRLESMLSCIVLSSDGNTLIRDEHLIRCISSLYHEDKSLSVEYKTQFSQLIIHKMESATMLKYLTRGEFHGLMMMLLSVDSSHTTRSHAMKMLHEKWSTMLSTYPVDQRVDYYVVFFELLDCYGCSENKYQLMKTLFEDMDALVCSFPENNIELSTMYRLMKLRLLNNHYAVLSPPERIVVCEDLLKQLMRLLPDRELSADFPKDSRIDRCVVKTQIVIQLDLMIARCIDSQRGDKANSVFSLFSSTFMSNGSARHALHQQAISSIWQSPADLEGLSVVLSELQNGIFSDENSACVYILDQLSGLSDPCVSVNKAAL